MEAENRAGRAGQSRLEVEKAHEEGFMLGAAVMGAGFAVMLLLVHLLGLAARHV